MKIRIQQKAEPNPTTQHGVIVKWLRMHGRITNAQAVSLRILRLSERMRELRAEGWGITDAERVQGGVFEYRLTSDPYRVEVRMK